MKYVILTYFSALIFFAYGYYSSATGIWPSSYVEEVTTEINAFLEGDEADAELTLAEKLKNDFAGGTQRYIPTMNKTDKLNDVNFEKVFPGKSLASLPKFHSHGQSGTYLVYGYFNLATASPGILWLNSDGTATRFVPFNLGKNSGLNRSILLNDGSIIANPGGKLMKFDWCGQKLWQSNNTGYHHEMSQQDNNSIWTLRDDSLVQVKIDDGTKIKEILIKEIFKKNYITPV